MKSSSYLNWFRRLVVLGAVIAAGALVSTAGAGGRPPDIQDIARANVAANVNRPPDIGDVSSRVSANAPDLFERYAAEHPYGRGLIVTPTTLVNRPPDIGDVSSRVSANAPDLFERYAAEHPYGRGLTVTPATLVNRPPDVTDTALALQSTSVDQSSGFNWSDWGIGIGTGMGLALLLGIAFLMSRQLRHRAQPA